MLFFIYFISDGCAFALTKSVIPGMEKGFCREMALLANTDNPDTSTCKKQGDELQSEEGKKRRCSLCWGHKAQDALTPSQLLV